MRKILILGAGKSSISLIDYLVENATAEKWELMVADMTEELARQKTKGRPHTKAAPIDIKNEQTRRELIQSFDIVISMLPATFH